jgi:hypothetical protein
MGNISGGKFNKKQVKFIVKTTQVYYKGNLFV